MVRNYLIIAFRNILKYKGHSLINTLGLAVAIASCLLIFLYTQFEYSFDKFLPESDNIYLVAEQIATTPAYVWTKGKLIPEFLSQSHAGVKEGMRMRQGEFDLKYTNHRFSESGYYADSTYFTIFPLPLLAGDPQTCLDRKDGVVISEKLAKKLFRESPAYGQTLEVDFKTYVVRGVMENQPNNFSFQTDIILPFSAMPENRPIDWMNTNTMSVLLMDSKADIASLEETLHTWANTRITLQTNYSLFPLTENHLYSPEDKARRRLYSLLLIALAILVIASINFTNLVTVRGITRNQEIGVRKVLGATRKQLVFQFMGEAILMSLIATGFGAAFTDLLLPFFNDLMDLELSVNYLNNGGYFLALLMVGLGVGILSGIYPSLVLSKLAPAVSLRGKLQHNKSGMGFRNALVVIQFSLSVLLIIGTGVVWKQIQYMKSQDLQLEADGVYAINMSPEYFADPEIVARKIDVFKQKMLQHSAIEKVAFSRDIPGDRNFWGMHVTPEGRNDKVWLRWSRNDMEYFPLYEMDLIEGRNFSDSLTTDVWRTGIINETAKKLFGWETAAGKTLSWDGYEIKIIGVVKDYHFASLEEVIDPIVHFYPGTNSSESYEFVSIKLAPGPVGPTIDYIKEELQAIDPSYDFETFFVDDWFNELYEGVERNGQIVGIFAFIAIFLASLGLLGLASFIVIQRTKEIGIRKVLGASLSDILVLLGKNFTLLIGIAVLLAIPAGYLIMNSWLEAFPYRMTLQPDIFLLSGAIALILSWLTIGYHVISVARANPVDALRDD